MRSDPAGRAVAIARQHLETSLLFGVPFVPVASGGARRENPARAASAATAAPAPVADRPAPAPARTPVPAEVPRTDQVEALARLRARHDAECPHCTTATAHTRTVFGEGAANADIMFIGEAPGADEDRTGRPFVGRAGRKLDEIIGAMGMRREDVFIANILKSRPLDNRTPLEHEIAACAPFLAEQIAIIRPRAIVALGAPSARFLLQTSTGITRLRGRWGTWTDAVNGFTVPVMPTFHPAYLLRNYTPDTRKKVWSDMQAVMSVLIES